MKSVFCVLFIAVLLASTIPLPGLAAVNSWQQSASIVPRWTDDFSSNSFWQSVRNLKTAGADWVTLVVPWYQSSIHSIDIHRGWNTPPDATLINAIDFIHSLGMKVSLKPHVESNDGNWRAYINPGNRTGWFANYGTVLKHYATLGQAHGVEEIILGTELISMTSSEVNSTNTANWNTMIDDIRPLYGGRLIYSANWGGPSGFNDEKNKIGFWHKLDAVGISAYFELTSDWNNSVEFLKSAWDNWNNTDIRPLHERTGKPIIFPEIGYRSVGGAHTDPWNCCRGSYSDETEQANSYEALFSYWNDYPYMIGVGLWEWSSDPNAGGPGDGNYTPQRKKAEEVMKKWWGSSAPAPSPTPPPPTGGDPSFTASASASPQSPQTGTSQTITTKITNSGSNVAGIVDIEIYNSGGSKIFQKVFEGETLSGEKNYTASWTPANTGEYKVKIGIFKSGWSGLYHWEDGALTFNVGGESSPSPTPTPPPSQATIDIWWPTDGSRIGGTQPFKAMVKELSVTDYQLFWQVDGDRLNTMFDSNQDYPHKEALVDLSGWNWKGAGPYVINFVARTLGGSALADRAVNIFIGN